MGFKVIVQFNSLDTRVNSLETINSRGENFKYLKYQWNGWEGQLGALSWFESSSGSKMIIFHIFHTLGDVCLAARMFKTSNLPFIIWELKLAYFWMDLDSKLSSESTLKQRSGDEKREERYFGNENFLPLAIRADSEIFLLENLSRGFWIFSQPHSTETRLDFCV